jgi:hypothetical protein
LRLNVTDSDGLKNSTYTTIGIDNTGPTVDLDNPRNRTNIMTNNYELNASVTDNGIGVNVATFLYRQNSTSEWQPACSDTDGNAPFNCTWDLSGLADGRYYQIMVYANDSFGNRGGNDTHYNITVDRNPPAINLESPQNDTWSLKDVIFYYNVSDETLTVANCSLIIDNKINQTNKTITEDASLNFTAYNLTDGTYNWNINCTDRPPRKRKQLRNKNNKNR